MNELVGRVIALGFFDGVHLGHASLLEMARKRASELGLRPAVMSFDLHPDNLVAGAKVSLINSAADREEILSRCFGIDDVILAHFDEHLMQAYLPSLSESLGIFIPLIVVNCIILGRAEAFASKNSVAASALDGVFQGLGYTIVLVIMCIVRELLGSGTFGGGILGADGAGIRVLPEQFPAMMMILPVGGFLTLGVLIAVVQYFLNKSKKGADQ